LGERLPGRAALQRLGNTAWKGRPPERGQPQKANGSAGTPTTAGPPSGAMSTPGVAGDEAVAADTVTNGTCSFLECRGCSNFSPNCLFDLLSRLTAALVYLSALTKTSWQVCRCLRTPNHRIMYSTCRLVYLSLLLQRVGRYVSILALQ
jgi:hypothetical protein